MKRSDQSIGELSEFHFEKELGFFSFPLRNHSRNEEISYSRTPGIVGIGAKEERRVRIKFRVTLLLYKEGL